MNNQKNEAYKASSNSVVYNSLKIELENRKSLLETLSKRQSETDVSSQAQGTGGAQRLGRGQGGLSAQARHSPNKRKNVLMGFLLGLAGGIGLAWASSI